MTYKEYKNARQEEFNNLPIFYAFSDRQFAEQMEKRGLTVSDTDKIYKLGNSGGFYLKSDADVITQFFNKPDKLSELMKNYDFAVDAIYYEMADHEYHINWQADYDVCSCFGKIKYTEEVDELDQYFNQLGWEEVTRRAYYDARRKFYKDADEKGWY